MVRGTWGCSFHSVAPAGGIQVQQLKAIVHCGGLGKKTTSMSLGCAHRRIGTQTNNVVEARGLAFAVKAALHFWFWFVESCAQAVETRTL